MERSLKDPNLKEAARFCGFCWDYCKRNVIATNENVHSRQAIVFLRVIKNSVIAKKAEEICHDCKLKSAGIISLLEPHGIIIPMKESLDSLFMAAAENCNRCYKNSKNDSNMFFAQQCISDIMKSYGKKSRNYKLAEEISTYCNNCGFRDPKIKNNLEGYGIRI